MAISITVTDRELEYLIFKTGGRSNLSGIRPGPDNLSALAAMSLVGRLEAARVIDSLNLLTPSEAREVLELMEPDLGKP